MCFVLGVRNQSLPVLSVDFLLPGIDSELDFGRLPADPPPPPRAENIIFPEELDRAIEPCDVPDADLKCQSRMKYNNNIKTL